MVCSGTWGLCWENEWMWLIPQTETDNDRATEQEERAFGYVCIVNPPVVCDVFFFGGFSWGQCCFFLLPEAVQLSERQLRGLAFVHVRLRIKQKALISVMPTLPPIPEVLTCWNIYINLFCISTFKCGLLLLLDYTAKASKLILHMWHETRQSHYYISIKCRLIHVCVLAQSIIVFNSPNWGV